MQSVVLAVVAQVKEEKAAWGCPSRREMITLFLLACAFPLQLCQSGRWSMGFPSVTALVLFCGWLWVRMRTSPSSGSAQWCKSSHWHMETITPTAEQCPMPGVPHRRLWGQLGKGREGAGVAERGEKKQTQKTSVCSQNLP